MKQNIDLIDEIISSGGISDTHLRMLVDEITVSEKDKKLSVAIGLKAQFRRHQDYYDDNGNMNDRAFEIWWFEDDPWTDEVYDYLEKEDMMAAE